MSDGREFLLADEGQELLNIAGLSGPKSGIARNIKQAIEIARHEEHDMILMDIQMPKLDGREATRLIRDKGFIDIPIIAMTAEAMKGDKEKIINAGCDDYISKPFEPEIILDKIKKWL